MLQPLVVGLGRAGAGLHLAVLARVRAAAQDLVGPVVACDPRREARARIAGVTVTRTIAQACSLVPPESAVVHVCTPPTTRFAVLEELANRGFRRMIVEKPLATGLDELDRISRLRDRHDLELVVVAHWLRAGLTRRLREVIRDRRLGELRSISVVQHKPRFLRSLSADDHPTAFDVELPHSLAVGLQLAGHAEFRDAECTPMRCGDTVLPGIGSARLLLLHESGVVSRFFSNLSAPVRERSITLEFEDGTAIGHYPLDERDDHAQFLLGEHREVFRDDALTAFVLHAYQAFADGRPESDFSLHREVVRLLCAAKRRCSAEPGRMRKVSHHVR